MQACVYMRRDDGEVFVAGHGAVVGRLSRADVPVLDPRVSEAHALISLRGEAFHLLALRGRFVVNGQVSTDVELSPGLEVEVARGVRLVCDDVVLPDRLLAVEAEGMPPTVLHGVTALVARPRPETRAGFRPAVGAHLFVDGDGVVLHRQGHEPKRLVSGDAFEVDDVAFRLSSVALQAGSAPRTQMDGRIDAPLCIVARFDTVHLQRAGRQTTVLSGIGARIVSELVLLGGTASWEVLAREVWNEGDINKVRHRLDVGLSRLRRRLVDAEVRSNLVQMDGCGQVELVLMAHDVVVDET